MRVVVRFLIVPLLMLLPDAQAADIGGWMQHKDRVALPADQCPELIAQGARTPPNAPGAADSYYTSGLCYLYSHKVGRDTTAARAWLTRASELGHPQATRALAALGDISSVQLHPPGPHCHDLGLDRKLCHGGAANP